MEKETTNLSLRKDIKERAIKAVEAGSFGEVNSLSGLVEVALEKMLHSVGINLELETDLRSIEAQVQRLTNPEKRAKAEEAFLEICDAFGYKLED